MPEPEPAREDGDEHPAIPAKHFKMKKEGFSSGYEPIITIICTFRPQA